MMRSSVPTRGRRRSATLALVAMAFTATTGLAACGQKGPLKLPSAARPASPGMPTSTPEPAAAPAPAR